MVRRVALLLSAVVMLVLALPNGSLYAAEPKLELLADDGSAFGWKVEGPTTATTTGKNQKLILEGSISYPAVLPRAGTGMILYQGDLTIEWFDTSEVLICTVECPKATLNVVMWFLSSDGQKLIVATDASGLKANAYALPQRCLTLGMRLKSTTPTTLQRISYTPPPGASLFNAKDLNGWSIYQGDVKREASIWTVTPAGELQVKNGPGDLQTTQLYQDFLIRLDVKTLGKHLNSGLFFRCLPGQYQQGYEAQIRNEYANGDRTKPIDYGTGAIYRRVPTRKVVSDDEAWFTMHVLAVGPQIRTWVNGQPTVAWLDDRPAAENARQGAYLKPGALSLQGHDPTTNILFKNFYLVDLAP